MTILCSPKVTQHHGQVNDALPPGSAVLPAGKTRADPASSALGRLAVFIGTRMSFRKLSTYAPAARMMERQTARLSGVDDIAGLPLLPEGKSCSSCGAL